MHTTPPVKSLFILVATLLMFAVSHGQVHCGLVQIEPNTSVNAMMTFDSFSKYTGGYTINGVAKIRVRVEDKAVIDPLCSWNLIMTIENNPAAGTPANEWEELNLYGIGGGQNPTIDALEIRIRNSCATSPIDGIFNAFTNNMDVIDIIAPMLPVTPAGTCAINTNGPGSYMTNYDEFNFTIDIRVKPGYDFNPGIFQLNVKFKLEENI
ncbi:MAG: hypothetical protein ACPGVC_06720 [Salibacteraceae bacterium]